MQQDGRENWKGLVLPPVHKVNPEYRSMLQALHIPQLKKFL